MSEIFDEARKRSAEHAKFDNRNSGSYRSGYEKWFAATDTKNVEDAKKRIDDLLTKLQPITEDLRQHGIIIRISKLTANDSYIKDPRPQRHALGFERIERYFEPGSVDDNGQEYEPSYYKYNIININELTIELNPKLINKSRESLGRKIAILKANFRPLPESSYKPEKSSELITVPKNSFSTFFTSTAGRGDKFPEGILGSMSPVDLETCIARFRTAVIEAISIYILD